MLLWQRDAVSLPCVRFGTEEYLHRKNAWYFSWKGLCTQTVCIYTTQSLQNSSWPECVVVSIVFCSKVNTKSRRLVSDTVCVQLEQNTLKCWMHTHTCTCWCLPCPLGVWCACQLCLGWGERGYESDSVSWFGPTAAQSSSESITQTIHEWFHCEGTVQLITVNSHCRIFSIIFRIDS